MVQLHGQWVGGGNVVASFSPNTSAKSEYFPDSADTPLCCIWVCVCVCVKLAAPLSDGVGI